MLWVDDYICVQENDNEERALGWYFRNKAGALSGPYDTIESVRRAYGSASTEPLFQPNKNDNYEIFRDSSYYDMWCVRNTDDRRFESPMSFHFAKKEDVDEFKRLIELAK